MGMRSCFRLLNIEKGEKGKCRFFFFFIQCYDVSDF